MTFTIPTQFLAAVAITLAVLFSISTMMRLSDLERRLDSAERSLDRLAALWWQGMYARYGYVPEEPDETAGQE